MQVRFLPAQSPESEVNRALTKRPRVAGLRPAIGQVGPPLLGTHAAESGWSFPPGNREGRSMRVRLPHSAFTSQASCFMP